MSDFERFAKLLSAEADELDDYVRNLTRDNGGDEPDFAHFFSVKASILHEVAKAAAIVADSKEVSHVTGKHR